MSVVKGKLVKMEVIQVGEYEFTKQDIIGHGAFAMVYKGRKRRVRTYDFISLFIFVCYCFYHSCMFVYLVILTLIFVKYTASLNIDLPRL